MWIAGWRWAALLMALGCCGTLQRRCSWRLCPCTGRADTCLAALCLPTLLTPVLAHTPNLLLQPMRRAGSCRRRCRRSGSRWGGGGQAAEGDMHINGSSSAARSALPPPAAQPAAPPLARRCCRVRGSRASFPFFLHFCRWRRGCRRISSPTAPSSPPASARVRLVCHPRSATPLLPAGAPAQSALGCRLPLPSPAPGHRLPLPPSAQRRLPPCAPHACRACCACRVPCRQRRRGGSAAGPAARVRHGWQPAAVPRPAAGGGGRKGRAPACVCLPREEGGTRLARLGAPLALPIACC